MDNELRITKELIRQIEKEAKKYFIGASGCHDWSHVERVKLLALNMGRKEKADLKIIELAAILHDIGRKDEMKKRGLFCHAEMGAGKAKKILRKHGFNKKLRDDIVHCIKTHRFRKNNIPKTIEAKVLFDADKLDAIGVVGLSRAFLFAGGSGSNNIYTGNEKKLAKSGKDYLFTKEDSAILEYELKLKYIKNGMLTETGRKVAKNRHSQMKKFVEICWDEVKGKK